MRKEEFSVVCVCVCVNGHAHPSTIFQAFSKEWDKKVQQDGPSSRLVPSPSGVAYCTASADDSHDMVQVSSVCFWLQLVGHS